MKSDTVMGQSWDNPTKNHSINKILAVPYIAKLSIKLKKIIVSKKSDFW